MIFLNPLMLAAAWACLPNSECPELEQTKAWVQEAKQLQQQGKYSSAETLLRRVLKTSANEGWAMIQVLNQLAGVLFLKADYCEAEATARYALDLNSRQAKRDDLKQAETLNTLAEILRARDQIAEAEALQQQTLAFFQARLGKDHPSTLTVQENRASLLAQQGRFREAVAISRQVLAGREKRLEPDSPYLATTLSNLAGYEMAVGNHVNVEPLYRRALAIRERASGPNHPEVAVLLNNLAERLRREGKQREAEPLYRRALRIQEMQAVSHPDYATTLNNWAEFLAGRRRKNEAEAAYRKAWSVALAALGSNHVLVATIQENLARHLQSIRKNEEALTLLERSVEIRSQRQGPEHPDVLETLSALNRLRGGQSSRRVNIGLTALRHGAYEVR
jgi:tetratricopeptide (TPR) repeat protein